MTSILFSSSPNYSLTSKTFIGPIVVVLNPYQALEWSGHGPHPHSVVAEALKCLNREHHSQSIIISGESGPSSETRRDIFALLLCLFCSVLFWKNNVVSILFEDCLS
jgi:hypothetical protein